MAKQVMKTLTASYVALTAVILTLMQGGAGARELRPSDHGLEYQTAPPAGQKLPPEMKAFFGAKNANSSSSSSASAASDGGVALPKAMNANDTAWWDSVSGAGKGREHVRHVLLVASLVCGVTGVVLLVTSGLVYLFMRHSKKEAAAASSSYSSSPPPDATDKDQK
ncbi:hypothetical protein Tsubulata_036152 [Turnera subulata]|uniref:Uncharacterized protein n=1 Tax=Turnera subulata TaxID=218843 RepID=A0A9Q0JPV9_9ROSI|nr:hypothetical protein Tsubulata_036152 [Turnera subulata]